MKSLPQLQAEATISTLTTVLQMLHEREILPLQDVVSRLESQEYTFVAGHDHEANPALQVLIDQLQQLADAYQQQGKQSSGPSQA